MSCECLLSNAPKIIAIGSPVFAGDDFEKVFEKNIFGIPTYFSILKNKTKGFFQGFELILKALLELILKHFGVHFEVHFWGHV